MAIEHTSGNAVYGLSEALGESQRALDLYLSGSRNGVLVAPVAAALPTLKALVDQAIAAQLTPELATIRKLRDALAYAPSSLESISRTVLDITYGGQDETPQNLGGYVRHWATGEGTAGYGSAAYQDMGDGTRIYLPIPENLGPVYGGGVRYNCHDQSKSEYQCVNGQFGDRAGDNSGFFMGFRLRNGQRFSFSTRSHCRGTIQVDGAISQEWVPQGGYINVNLGSVGDRYIIVRGSPDTWIADICFEQNAIVEPWNFEGTKLRVNHGGDSYSQGGVNNMMFGEAIGVLTGGLYYAGTAIGGTGYSTNNRNYETPNLQWPARFDAMTTGNPDVLWIMMGINDGWPSSNNVDANGNLGVEVDTTEAMRSTYVNARAKLPNAMFVVVSGWVPKGSDATNPNGKAKLMADAMRATLQESLTGPWIFLNTNDGSWETSAGTVSNVPALPWITGNGYEGNETGDGGVADTWIGQDGTHLTPVGYRGVIALAVSKYKAALASML